MTNLYLIILIIAAAVVALLQVLLLLKKSVVDFAPMLQGLQSVEKSQERMEKSIRDDIGRNREETTGASGQLRGELRDTLTSANNSVLTGMTAMAETQNKQLAGFSEQLGKLTESNQQKLDGLKDTVEAKLKSIQQDNAKQLDQMRATVEEKLQGTLEKRLGESFKLVSERLEQVYRGLGEMQNLATGVGDLKRVLTNVKTRGTWGEVQLGAMLEQILSPGDRDHAHALHRQSLGDGAADADAGSRHHGSPGLEIEIHVLRLSFCQRRARLPG